MVEIRHLEGYKAEHRQHKGRTENGGSNHTSEEESTARPPVQLFLEFCDQAGLALSPRHSLDLYTWG